MLTYIFDTMKLKVLFLLNCEYSKYNAKLFSLSIYCIIMYCIVLYFPRYSIGKRLVGEIRGGHPEILSRLLIRERSGSVVECLTRD